MRLEIQFRGMARSEALESLVTEKIQQSVSGFLHRHDAHIMIWLISERNLANRGTGSFVCEVEVRAPRKQAFFVAKQDSDMHVAIQNAADKLKVILDEAGKKEIYLRNNPPPIL